MRHPAACFRAGCRKQRNYLEPPPVLPEPVPPEPLPVMPELPPEDPAPEVPAPLALLPVLPLAPEDASPPSRRSQPTAVMLSAARTSKILDVVLIAFILVPFMKNLASMFIRDRFNCDKFWFCQPTGDIRCAASVPELPQARHRSIRALAHVAALVKLTAPFSFLPPFPAGSSCDKSPPDRDASTALDGHTRFQYRVWLLLAASHAFVAFNCARLPRPELPQVQTRNLMQQ